MCGMRGPVAAHIRDGTRDAEERFRVRRVLVQHLAPFGTVQHTDSTQLLCPSSSLCLHVCPSARFRTRTPLDCSQERHPNPTRITAATESPSSSLANALGSTVSSLAPTRPPSSLVRVTTSPSHRRCQSPRWRRWPRPPASRGSRKSCRSASRLAPCAVRAASSRRAQ